MEVNDFFWEMEVLLINFFQNEVSWVILLENIEVRGYSSEMEVFLNGKFLWTSLDEYESSSWEIFL